MAPRHGVALSRMVVLAAFAALAACGARTRLFDATLEEPGAADAGQDAVEESPAGLDASPMDAAVDADADTDTGAETDTDADTGAETDTDADADADAAPDADASCLLGTVVGDVFGTPTSFLGGMHLPAGRYRLTYVDGCMLYSSSGQGWTVNAYALGNPSSSDHWWITAQGALLSSVIPPGTVGYLVGQGAFATFDACVQANLQQAPVDFDFAGGTLGVWLEDGPYSDNVAGPGGRAPSWSLQCLQ